MSNIIGHFYFKRTATGNLIGEYSNTSMKTVNVECSNIQGIVNGFIGKHTTLWEEEGETVLMDLEISFKKKSNDKIYSLVWKEKDKEEFWGEGFLMDGILIGSYRNFNPILQGKG